LGQLDNAADCCRAALRRHPDFPEAANCLGLVYLARGLAEQAAACFRDALRARPAFALAYTNLANALRLMGDRAGALEHYRRAVQLDPGLAVARSNLGQWLLECGHPLEALEHCREAVRLQPHLAEAHSNLGNALRDLGRLAEAKVSYAEALRLNPGRAMVVNNIGQALQEEGRLDEAIAWYRRALAAEPASARFQTNLAGALHERDDLPGAEAAYHTALGLDPGYAEAHAGLGVLRHEQGRYGEARACLEEALRLAPELAVAHSSLGTLRVELNEPEAAQSAFRAALGHDPRCAAAWAQLATLLRDQLTDDERAALERLAADPDLPDRKRTGVLFGLAHVLDARGEYDRAAGLLSRANALQDAEWRARGPRYDPDGHARFVSRLIATCTPEFFARLRGAGLETRQPVFIVGLPRSGTTLVEQVLASHSQVFGAGELPLAHESFLGLPGADGDESRALEALGRLDAAAVHQVAQRHLDRLGAISDRAARITDKMPDNYLYLALLAALFPKARFIHCRRDPRDVAVSCWMTHFRSIRWANDPEHIVARIREYRRLMEHWRAVLPVPVLEIDYEATVADLEGVARRLVDWCGLEWEPGCLAFHTNKRPVRTASVGQVRQPIYTRSVARWKHYEAALGPLFTALDSAI
jgi:tetratricopeptide (TPR) repeat protein